MPLAHRSSGHGSERRTEVTEFLVRVIPGKIPRVWFCTYPIKNTLEYIWAFCLTASQLAANSQTSNLPPILTRHRRTVELRVVGIGTSRTESLIKEPTPESNDLAMSRLRTHPRKDYQLLGLLSSNFTQRVYSQLANVYEVCGSTE